MKLTYCGPLPTVFVPVHDEYLDISVGDTVEFSDELAASLLEQEGNWKKAGARAKTVDTEDPA